MKFKYKLYIYFLTSLLVLLNIFCQPLSLIHISAESNEKINLYNILAGTSDLSQQNITRSDVQIIPNGVYYLNGKHSGDYLHNNSSTPIATSGLISTLGNSILWEITYRNGYYTICSYSDSTKYLAVSTAAMSSDIQLITINNSTSIPEECLWNITMAVGGACLLQNKYNSRYLYSYGSTVHATNSLGPEGASNYSTRVWRVTEQNYIVGKELNNNTEFYQSDLLIGYAYQLKYKEKPDSALWTEPYDFTYSGYDSGIISVSATGIITPLNVGQTNILCIHKATNRTFTATVIVRNVISNLGSLSSWADIERNIVGHWTHNPSVYREKLNSDGNFYFLNSVSDAISKWNSAIGTNITVTTTESDADIVIYGGTSSELAALGYTIASTSNGYTSWNYTYLGHYTYNNTVKLGAKIDNATILIKSSGRTTDEYIKTCTHEMGHSLGFFGHAASPSAVMYAYGHSQHTLLTAEKNHLSQVYN